MIRLKPTQDQINRAKSRFNFGALPRSISKGGGNIYGALGEIIVFDYFTAKEQRIIDESTYDYDFVINGLKWDIKTRVIRYSLKMYHRCSIPAYSDQKTDYYLFVFIKKDFSTAWLAGYIGKERFLDIARPYKKGDRQPYLNEPFPVDTNEILVRQLKRIKL